jgi:[ribosomal protein S18]-alanine N-acetyltransferase
VNARLEADVAAPEVHVVPMLRRHLRSVLRIEGIVYPRPWTLRLFLAELAMQGSRVYRVARVDNEVVGYAGLMVAAGEGHVTTLAVDPAWHRQGIGTRLLHTITSAGVARGCNDLTLEVRMSNAPAQALYRRFGFAPAGVRKGYYAEVNEDALVMWAHDVAAPDYAARLDRIAAGIPGRTVVEGGA